MSVMFYLYITTILDGVKGSLTFISVVFGLLTFVVSVVNTVCYINAGEEAKKELLSLKLTKKGYLFGTLCIFTMLANSLLPSSKHGLMLVSAGAVLEAAKSPNVQTIFGQSTTLINKFLEKQIVELTQDTEELKKNAKEAASGVVGVTE